MLAERIQQWEEARKEFLITFHKLPYNLGAVKPSPERWSACQIAEHLSKVDGFVLRAIHKGNATENLSKPGVMNEILTRFACFYLKSPLKLNVPTDRIAPSESADVDEVLSNWNAIQQELLSAARNMPPKKQAAAIFKHPIIGMINLEQTFRFLTEHIRNHHRQLQKLIVTLSEK